MIKNRLFRPKFKKEASQLKPFYKIKFGSLYIVEFLFSF